MDRHTIGLMTGKTVKMRNKNGDLISKFVPKISNKFPALKEVIINSEKSGRPTTLDAILSKDGVRAPKLEIDYKIFQKSDEEKRLLKTMKKNRNKILRKKGLNPKKVLNL